MSLLLDCRKFCLANGLLSCQAMIAGVSGGADSMCLLDILFSLSEDSKKAADSIPFPKIIAAHVNHGLRGDAADQDEELVRNYCSERNIPFLVLRTDIAALAKEKKISLEEAGRNVRYSFFEETAQKLSCEYQTVFTAVAHHREDQGETILMNLFRGTGPDGLCGMRPKAQGIVRPLLFASKDSIVNYLTEKGIPYSEDLTNMDNTYTRNRWRNQILPLIADVSRKDPVSPLLAVSELLNSDKEYFEEKVSVIFELNKVTGGQGTYGLPCSVILHEHRAVGSRLVRYLYNSCFACGTDLTSVHVAAILSLIEDQSGGRKVSLAHGRMAYIAEGILFFYEPAGSGTLAASWQLKGSAVFLAGEESNGEILLRFDEIRQKTTVSIPKTSYQVAVNLVENPEQVVYNSRTWYCPLKDVRGAVFRTKRPGDWFSRAGSTGGKPLRRFLTDRKIPGFVRDRMILAVRDSNVLWIPGLAHSTGFVDAESGRRYFESLGQSMNEYSVLHAELYRITIIDRNEQEEH